MPGMLQACRDKSPPDVCHATGQPSFPTQSSAHSASHSHPLPPPPPTSPTSCSEDLSELRTRNTQMIRACRGLHLSQWSDSRGYDLLLAPKGSTTTKDGTKVVVFTKQEYRNPHGPLRISGRGLPADAGEGGEEGEEEEVGGKRRRGEVAAAARRGRGRGRGRGRSVAQHGAVLGGRMGHQQRTLDEFVKRAGVC